MARDFLPSPICASACGPSKTSKTRDVLDQRLVGGAGGLEHGLGLDAGVEDEGEVALDRLQVGEPRAAGGWWRGPWGRAAPSRCEGEGDGGAAHVEGGRMRGWSSPKAASDGLRAEGEDGGAAGVEPGGGGALEHQRGGRADGGERGLGVGAGVPEVDRAAGAVRVARGGGADAEAGGEQRLLAGLAAGEDLADLEEREVGEAARLVAGGGAQEAGQQVGAQVAHLGADRVLEAHGLGAAAEERGGGARR